MERYRPYAHTWLICLTFMVAVMAGAMVHGGSRWVDMAARTARFTGWRSPVSDPIPAAEALLPEPVELRLVLFLPAPEPVLRAGVRIRRNVVPASWQTLSRAKGGPSMARSSSGGDRPDRIREWQPPPRAPDWV